MISDDDNINQIDAICKEFEAAWSLEDRPDIGAFLSSDDFANRDELVRRLVEIDIRCRRLVNESVRPEDYQELDTVAVRRASELLADDLTTQKPKAIPENIEATGKEKTSQRIGPYKLLQHIADGGMGSVWMAEQETPLRRRVALKLVKGLDADTQVVARFEAERQALAMMDHPNIAKVYDAGTTDTGHPYFVMELVQGIPIHEYCDRNRLTPVERLELFVPVCQAVQHAHQKGIIHRDLKPSNVLIAIQDDRPVAKVIDFGLAKALQHQTRLTDKTLFTEFGKVVGTLQYMSPEQAMIDALNVDTRSDIYSLGVMLYELLTGSTPLEKEMIRQKAMLQVLQIIREQDPPRPSHRLSTSGEKIESISERRQIEPFKFQQILRGELDWIVMKALEKDRTRRYDSASDFAQDIRRFLDGDAVEARPPSTGYRLGKFLRRHRGLTAMAALTAMLLVISTAVSGWFAFDADHARKLSEQRAKNLAAEKDLVVEQRKRATDAERLAKRMRRQPMSLRRTHSVARILPTSESPSCSLTNTTIKRQGRPSILPPENYVDPNGLFSTTQSKNHLVAGRRMLGELRKSSTRPMAAMSHPAE